MQDDPMISVTYGGVQLVPEGQAPPPKTRGLKRVIEGFSTAISAFTMVLVVLSLTTLTAVTWREVFGRPVILEPIGIPEPLQNMGFSSEVAAQRLWDAVVEINDTVDTVKGHTSFVSQARRLEVTEPNTGFSIQGLADMLRALIDLPQKRVAGEFLCRDVTCAPDDIELRVRVIDGPRLNIARIGPIGPLGSDRDLDAYFHKAGLEVLRLVDPYVLALHLTNQKQFDHAMSVAEAMVAEEHFDTKWGHVSIGHNLGAQKQYEKAVASYERALKLDPGFALAAHNIAANLISLNRHEEAATTYARAIELDPEFIPSYIGFAEALMMLDRSDEAIASLDRALAREPESTDALLSKGNLLTFLQRSPEAIEIFERLLALETENAIALHYIANAFASTGNYEKALLNYRLARDADPDSALMHFGVGMGLNNFGRFEEAIPSFIRALELNPAFVDAHFELALTQTGLQDYDAAIVSYRKALDLAPNNLDINFNLGALFLDLGRLDEAADLFQHVLALEPASAAAQRLLSDGFFTLAISQEGLGHTKKAQASIRSALKLDPDNAVAHFMLGQKLSKMKQYEAAVASFDRALEISPDDAEAALARQEALEKANQ